MESLKKYIPKLWADFCAFIFTLVMVHVIALFEMVVVLPYIDSDHEHHETRMPTFWLHFVLGVFMYVNIISSFAKAILVDSTTHNIIMPSVLKAGWRFCSSCEGNAPPRSFHCWTCNICILKRDHHCMFTGNCIGYSNMRYFITMVFYLCISAGYCCYLNMDYTWETVGGFTPVSIFTMIMPLFSWMLGFIKSFTFGVAFISSTCLIGFLLLTALFGYHMINTFYGQTTFERNYRNRDYDYGWRGNYREVFGEYWYIALLSPFISSPLPGDGIEFPKKYKFEDIKDM